ncbi:MAG TPA: hypothetical protein VF707_12415 [Ardenticatenaceae bacterium]|jgi:hypothetical protein
MLEQHTQTLSSLLRGGISRGVGRANTQAEDEVQNSLRQQWETQRNLLRRVLSEPGDPTERLLEWRERTSSFLDKFPERTGWTDREGQEWEALPVMEAIDKLLEQVEAWENEADDFEDYDE